MIANILTIRLKMFGKCPDYLDQPKRGHHVLLGPRALVRSTPRGDTRVKPKGDIRVMPRGDTRTMLRGGYAGTSVYGERLSKSLV